jgi:hypothetical protein
VHAAQCADRGIVGHALDDVTARTGCQSLVNVLVTLICSEHDESGVGVAPHQGSDHPHGPAPAGNQRRRDNRCNFFRGQRVSQTERRIRRGMKERPGLVPRPILWWALRGLSSKNGMITVR